jgi:hypothetical protein
MIWFRRRGYSCSCAILGPCVHGVSLSLYVWPGLSQTIGSSIISYPRMLRVDGQKPGWAGIDVSPRNFQHSPRDVMLPAVSRSVLMVYGRHASTMLVLGAWRAEQGGVFGLGERALLALVKPAFTP